MFEVQMLEPTDLADVGDAVVAAAIEHCARAEAAAAARGLAAIAELVHRRLKQEGERAYWSCDGWDSAAAEVGAALRVRRSRASWQMTLSLALRDRFPRVAALFLEGRVSVRVVAAIESRTRLVTDPDALAAIDAALVGQTHGWGPLSDYKLDQAVDSWVDKYDPGALRRTRINARGRELVIGDRNDDSDTASLRGRLYATDAAALEKRLTAMAHEVCGQDPRTVAQRRADAMGALAVGADHLACACGQPACRDMGEDKRAAAVTIHVVADARAVEDAVRDPYMSGESPGPDFARMPLLEAINYPTTPEPGRPRYPSGVKPGVGLLGSGGIVPAPLLAELIAAGAKVRYVRTPTDTAPEPRYRPSAALAEFVRCRDMACRFPGCEVPAERCDLDHTVAYPVGLTHPSNIKCMCRKHHLLKTFWRGWSDTQLPDGTVVRTSPAGRRYTTQPGCRIFFPTWNTTTADLPPPPPKAAHTNPGLMMPARRQTRAVDCAQRIAAERARNDEGAGGVPVDLRRECDDDPPPF